MIIAGRWVLPISQAPISNGAVVVKDGLIKEVGKKSQLLKVYPDEKIVDLGEVVILPGFVDTHTHLEFSTFRGTCRDVPFWAWKLELAEKSRFFTEEDWEISAQLGALEALQAGVTCIADITKTGASLKTAKVAGLRGVIFYEVSEMDSAKVEKVMEEAESKVGEWQKTVQGSLLQVGISPYSAYNVTPPLLKQVAQFAKDKGLYLATHLAGSKEEYDFVKFGAGPLAHQYREAMGWESHLWQPLGVSPVKYLENWGLFETPLLAVHCIQVDDYDIDVLERYDVRIAHCPRTSAKLGMGAAPLTKFLQRGIKVGLGTDSPASNYAMDFFDEMRVGLLLQRSLVKEVEALSTRKFVEMATLGGAQSLGLDEKIGSLEQGKEADLIAVDISEAHQFLGENPYNLLVYWADQENVVMTMVKGKVIYDKGEVKTLSLYDIIERAKPLKEKLATH